VTHQGSLPPPPDDLVSPGSAVTASEPSPAPDARGSCVAAGFLEPSPSLTEDAPIMTIPPEREAQILRYHHVEKWPPATIARHLNINRETVMRVLAQAGLARIGLRPRPSRIGLRPRPSRIDPYLPFIHQTLEKFPMLAASRLYAMVYHTVA
jgi:hypothetical protein